MRDPVFEGTGFGSDRAAFYGTADSGSAQRQACLRAGLPAVNTINQEFRRRRAGQRSILIADVNRS